MMARKRDVQDELNQRPAQQLMIHATRSATRKAEVAAVFGTVELLELVLTQLRIVDLLCCERVCQNWQSVIHSNIHLQRNALKMPLRPQDAQRWL